MTVIGLMFRGWFYRHLITYRSIGLRTNYAANNDELIRCINSSTKKLKEADIKHIIKLGLSISSNQLRFTASKNDIDPNKLIQSKTAHCVGYAAFFSTTCNYLLAKYNLANTWTAKPQVGQLYFIGINVHPYFNTPFFNDHDFVTIENKTTGQVYAVDPTLSDYLHIDFVNYTH